MKILLLLTREKTKFIWDDDCEKAFRTLINAFLNPPVLVQQTTLSLAEQVAPILRIQTARTVATTAWISVFVVPGTIIQIPMTRTTPVTDTLSPATGTPDVVCIDPSVPNTDVVPRPDDTYPEPVFAELVKKGRLQEHHSYTRCTSRQLNKLHDRPGDWV